MKWAANLTLYDTLSLSHSSPSKSVNRPKARLVSSPHQQKKDIEVLDITFRVARKSSFIGFITSFVIQFSLDFA